MSAGTTTSFPPREFFEEIRKIPGWFGLDQLEHIYDIALAAPGVGSFLEIGSFCGQSSCVIAQALVDRGYGERLYMIDPCSNEKAPPYEKEMNYGKGLRSFMKVPEDTEATLCDNVRSLVPDRNAVLLRGTSQECSKKGRLPEDFVFAFIDGDHRYEAAHHDGTWALYLMKAAGVIIWDDCHDRVPAWGVERAADELALNDRFEKGTVFPATGPARMGLQWFKASESVD